MLKHGLAAPLEGVAETLCGVGLGLEVRVDRSGRRVLVAHPLLDLSQADVGVHRGLRPE